MPKISLITCTYWRPDLLRRAIQSVQKQPFEDYEHIIISDHCPFAKHVYNDFKDDKRIKFYEVEAPYIYNLGAISFNLGIER
jgi:GT2 family glycosyltransferase